MAEEGFLKEVKETVTILRPMKSIFPRGSSSPREQSPAHSVRYHAEQLEDIKQAAAVLGVTGSEFIRWSAHAVALDILKQKKEYDMRQR